MLPIFDETRKYLRNCLLEHEPFLEMNVFGCVVSNILSGPLKNQSVPLSSPPPKTQRKGYPQKTTHPCFCFFQRKPGSAPSMGACWFSPRRSAQPAAPGGVWQPGARRREKLVFPGSLRSTQSRQLVMGQKPVPPANIQIPTEID